MGSQSAGIGSALPDQTDQSGKVLVTDGVVASWASPDTAALPVQTGHGGEFLTTDGTDPSWTPVTSTTLLPDQTGNSGKVLSTDGLGALSWIDASGVSLAAFGSTPAAKGADFTGGVLTLEPADGTNPGSVSIAAQTFAGAKTFSEGVKTDGVSSATAATMLFTGDVADGASAIGFTFKTSNSLTIDTTARFMEVFQGSSAAWSVIASGAISSLVPGGTYMLGRLNAAPNPLCLWLGPSSATASDTNYTIQGDGTNGIINAPNGAGKVYFRFAGAGGGPFIDATTLDLTGLGTGGAIKLKDAGGTTRTVTIDGAGAWVIT